LIRWGEKPGEVEISARLNYFPLVFVALVIVRGLLLGEPVGTACAVGACFVYLMWQQFKLRRFANRLAAAMPKPSEEPRRAG
jgi:hypothetical protein